MFDSPIDKCPQSTKTTAIILAIIVLLAAFIRFSYYISLCSDPLPTALSGTDIMDQFRFMQLAKEFSSGQWLGTFVPEYSPAYSYFIAVILKLFGQDMYYVFIVQFLMGTFTPLLFYKTATLLFENHRIGLIAAFIAALYSPLVFYEGAVLRAFLIAFLNLLSFYFLLVAIKEKKTVCYVLAGIPLGLSLILRPNIAPLVLIPYLFFVTRGPKKKALYLVLFSLSILLMIAPLSIRNKMLKRNTLVSYQGPSTFWIGNTFDSSGIGFWRSPLRHKFAKEADGSIIKTFKILFREIGHHPMEYLQLYARKVTMYFNAYEIPGNMSYDQFVENHAPLRWAFFDFFMISPLALLGLFLCWRRYPFISLCYLYFAVLGLSNIFFHIQGRYRIPNIPFFILFAAFGLNWLVYTFKQRKQKQTIIGFVLLGIFIFFTVPKTNIIRKYFGYHIREIDFGNRFIAYYLLYQEEGSAWSLGQKKVVLSKALKELEKQVAHCPMDRMFFADVLVQTSVVLTEMEMPVSANKATQYVLKLYPQLREELLPKAVMYNKNSFKDLSFKRFVSKKAFQNVFK